MADPTQLESVQDVLARHKEEITHRYQAAGVGIGKANPADQAYVITVYLTSSGAREGGPVSIEGITLMFKVTGPIRLLNHVGR